MPESLRKNGKYPVLGSNGRVGFHNEFLVNGPSIIVGRKGSVGEVVWEEENCTPIDTTFYVTLLNEDVELRFLYWILKAINLSELKGGAGVPGLNRNDAYELKIPLPPKPIRTKILMEIEAVEQKEKALNEEIQKLNAQIKSKYIELKDKSDLTYRLDDDNLFDVFIGKRVLKNEITNGDTGIPVYSANVFEPFGRINNEIIDHYNSPSILWGIDGGWMVNVIPAGQPFYPTDHCGVIRVKGGYLSLNFIAQALYETGIEKRFSRTFRASTERVKDIRISMPDEQAQKEFDHMAEDIHKEIVQIETELAGIGKQKEQILKKYLE